MTKTPSEDLFTQPIYEQIYTLLIKDCERRVIPLIEEVSNEFRLIGSAYLLNHTTKPAQCGVPFLEIKIKLLFF